MKQNMQQKIRIMAFCALATAASILQSGCQSNVGYIGFQGHGNLNSFRFFPQGSAWGHSYQKNTSGFYNMHLNGFKLPGLTGGNYYRY